MLTVRNMSFLFGITMCCECFTELCQMNKLSTYKNAFLSNGLLQNRLN